MAKIEKKWNEYPLSFPPVNTGVLAEFDTARSEWYKGFVLALGDDADGEFCQFRWVEGPKTNQTACYYTPESFKPLLPVENKQENSLDNLLKELHNLKQEEKELSDKIVGIIKDINQILDSCGLAVVYQDDL